MEPFERTWLWRVSLHPQADDADERPRDYMRTEFLKLRDNAALLAGEIPRVLPDFTDHSLVHLDALWETADEIVGETWKPTPTEAFALGASFLVHDLGMALVAYPGGAEQLRESRHWRDKVATAFRHLCSRFPEDSEIDDPPPEVRILAERLALRDLHAQRAEELPMEGWPTARHGTIHLLDDAILRMRLGRLIGKIAHSHAWDVAKVASELGQRIGAPALPTAMPRDWGVDPLMVACLLRLADASHLDARRAPPFQRALRHPAPGSEAHWIFHEHLERVRREESSDRLIYSTAQPFSIDEAAAWWVGFDLLGNVDRELRAVDALLHDLDDRQRPRFAAKAVAGVEDPTRLRKWLPTEGWVPTPARLKVTNVADLVGRIGGAELYGESAEKGLRELVQNAADAILLRRRLYPSSGPGRVTVSLRRTAPDDRGATDWLLSVSDDGIGMSTEVMTGTLLDFGNSLWTSDEAPTQHPGIFGSGFRPSGKFGIGFFAVFMLGDEVRVTSNRYGAAADATAVLEFSSGLGEHPLLREAKPEERMIGGGTTVTVKLAVDPFDDRGLIGRWSDSLEEVCVSLFPALSVDLYVAWESGEPQRVIGADDWQTMDPLALMRRLHLTDFGSSWVTKDPEYQEMLATIAGALRDVTDRDGRLIGRLALAPDRFVTTQGEYHISFSADVTCGGIKASNVYDFAGLLVGDPLKASRDEAVPRADSEALIPWAKEQIELIRQRKVTPLAMYKLAPSLFHVGLDPSDLPIALCAGQVMTGREASAYLAVRSEFYLCHEINWLFVEADGSYAGHDTYLDRAFRLEATDLVSVALRDQPLDYGRWRLSDKRDIDYRPGSEERDDWDPRGWWYEASASLAGWLLRRVAEVWGTDIPALLTAVTLHDHDDRPLRASVGKATDGRTHEVTVVRVSRPDTGADH